VLGGVLSLSFVRFRKKLDGYQLAQPARGMLCGLLVGLIALFEPHTLTWGEPMLEPLTRRKGWVWLWHDWHSLYSEKSKLHLWFFQLGVLKYIAAAVTTTSGYSAGIVFPLMFIGYCFGHGLGYPVTLILQFAFGLSLDSNADTSFGHCMSSAMLAGTMHTPLGTALLAQRMSGGGPLYLGMMLLANYIASSINTETLFGQKDIDDESTKTDRLPGETARNMESRQRQDELL